MIRPMYQHQRMATRNLGHAVGTDTERVPRDELACIPVTDRCPEPIPFGRPSEVPWDKRLLDLVIAVPALVVALPIMLAAAAAIRLASPGPALFRQVRIGHAERPFTMLKLRTMRVDGNDSAFRQRNMQEIVGEADPGSDGLFKAADDERIVPGGAFLRRYSIDELPQLLNVFVGSMSLVGPRPLPVAEQQQISGAMRRRLSMRPGITGLWQVSGRSDMQFDQWMQKDLEYLDNWSNLLDLKLLLLTLPAVIMGRGAR
jgi:lipopolysaccharide/colanic/teichoic acid biosynthesis glycosyltransferase